MPTTNKRINLTITEPVYERILQYKNKNGISSDAAACLQLIVRQLDNIDASEKMMQLMSRFTLEEVQQISSIGFKALQVMGEDKKVEPANNNN